MGTLITSSQITSTSKRGFGSIETSRVDKPWSAIARRENRVELPDPTSTRSLGFLMAKRQ